MRHAEPRYKPKTAISVQIEGTRHSATIVAVLPDGQRYIIRTESGHVCTVHETAIVD